MGFRYVLMLFVSVLLGCTLLGCFSERLSGTEVGNPEISVSARIGIVGEDGLAGISSLEMMVLKMEYHMPDDSMQAIWEYPAGMGVDLAAPATSGNLPMVKVKKSEWTSADLMLSSMKGDSALPDSISFADFSNPRYIKLVKMMNGDSVRFLFELPAEMDMKLRFDAGTLLKWREGDHLSIEIMFDCAKWASAVSGQTYQVRLDGESKPYILLAPGENAEVHGALKVLFPECFIADASSMI